MIDLDIIIYAMALLCSVVCAVMVMLILWLTYLVMNYD